MRQERRIKFVRVGQAVRTVGQLKGEPNVFAVQQPIFMASRQKIPTGMVALGDWLGCSRVDSRMGILHNKKSGNWPVLIQKLMATVAMGLGQVQRFLSCELCTGLHTCDLGVGLHIHLSRKTQNFL